MAKSKRSKPAEAASSIDAGTIAAAAATIPPIGGSFVIGADGAVTPGDPATQAHLDVHLAGGDPGAPTAPAAADEDEDETEQAADAVEESQS